MLRAGSKDLCSFTNYEDTAIGLYTLRTMFS